MRMKVCFLIALTILTVGVLSRPVCAADITWQDAEDIAGVSDVSTLGALIAAFNVGASGVPGTTVNGVSFQSFATSGGTGSSGNFSASGSGFIGESNTGGADANAPFSNLPAEYQTLLESYSVPYGGTVTLTISGLTIGHQYQFQFFSNCSSDMFGYELTASDADNDSVSTRSNDDEAEGGLGQYAIGTFTADAAMEVITFSGDGDGGFLNAFQLRDISAVPEPSSLLLLGLAGSGLLVRRNLRRRFAAQR